MMRSLFSGVSGLRSHQTRMDVIGNNIANVNTTGYKAKSLNFSDMLYQTTQAATGPNADNGTGGTNPRQIGLGVKTAAISTSITQEGSTQSTGNPFDLKISGEAFFVVSDGTSTFYTRDGAFDVDKAGNLVMSSTGYIVQGWGVDNEGNIVQGTVGNINVMAKNSYEAAATTQATISGIVDENDAELETTVGRQVNVPVYDSKGYAYNLKFGILPKTVEQTSVLSTLNTENEYAPAATIYKVDTSKLTYKYDGNQELKESSIPDNLLAKLEKAVWAVANNTTPVPAGVVTTGVAATAANGFGKSGARVTVDLGAFINADPDLSGTVLANSDLKTKTLSVEFSGGTGYTKGTNGAAPTYPIDSAVAINDAAVDVLYDNATSTTATGGVITCNAKSTASITAVKQTFTDEKGDSITKYIFRTGTGATDVIATDNPDDVVKLLSQLGKNTGKTNSYTTNSEQTYNKPITGEYTITLLGMTDPNKDDVNIDALKNSGTISWDLIYNKDNGKFRYVGSEGNESFTLALSALNTDGNFRDVTIDVSDTSNQDNGGKSSLEGAKADGRKLGTMTGVSIGTDGRITANYSNGMSALLGQICVGTFPNAMGLENAGDNLYQVTANSGDVSIVDIKASGTGSMTTGVLEMSNVDLSQQFTDMITTQRGFQANSRIITVSDTLLEELVNIKR